MRTIKTTTGAAIALDGDLLADHGSALSRSHRPKRELERSFEDMVKEIHHLIDQMDDGERRTYLAESLFLNTVKYENDKLEAYMKKLTQEMSPYVPELPRHPVSVLLAVEHAGHALRRPHRLRLRRSVRQARARRCPDARRCTTSGPGRSSRSCART